MKRPEQPPLTSADAIADSTSTCECRAHALPSQYGSGVPFLYILECRDGTYYTGSTWDLERRLRQHECGKGAAYTRHRLPVRLIWSEHFDRIEDAFAWEKRIQGWSHEKKRRFIEGNVPAVREYLRRGRGR